MTKAGAATAAGSSDGRLSYAAFLQVLLEFQLSGHLRYLSSFVHLFRQLDTRGKGVLDEEQFRKLAYALNPAEDKADDHLAHIDPFIHQRLTFSDCVACFTADLMRLQQQEEQQAADVAMTTWMATTSSMMRTTARWRRTRVRRTWTPTVSETSAMRTPMVTA